MSARFAELDFQHTPLGDLSLRRRREPTLGVEVYEVLLGEQFLMSSLFTVAEVELARLALAPLPAPELDVVVGGLGLGYTARAALDDPRVRTLQVVETLREVIGWHERGLLPLSAGLTADPRCGLVHGDFFERFAAPPAAGAGARRVHAVVVDIDHSPQQVLHPSHGRLYTVEGLSAVASHLHPGGVFALWSDAAPDEPFLARLHAVFAHAAAHVVDFPNHHTGGRSANTVYVAQLP